MWLAQQPKQPSTPVAPTTVEEAPIAETAIAEATVVEASVIEPTVVETPVVKAAVVEPTVRPAQPGAVDEHVGKGIVANTC